MSVEASRLELTYSQRRVLAVFGRFPPGRQLSSLDVSDRLILKQWQAFDLLQELEEGGFLVSNRAGWWILWSLGPMADALEEAGRFPGRES